MKIALDYDKTYSADPGFWDTFITLSMVSGHEIRGVTHRDFYLDRTAPLIDFEKKLTVHYTGGIAKRWYLEHFGNGFVPDIWIEDKPESVFDNSPISQHDLKVWRAMRDEGPTIPKHTFLQD